MSESLFDLCDVHSCQENQPHTLGRRALCTRRISLPVGSRLLLFFGRMTLCLQPWNKVIPRAYREQKIEQIVELENLRKLLREEKERMNVSKRMHLIDSVVHRTKFPPNTARSQLPVLEWETAGAGPTGTPCLAPHQLISERLRPAPRNRDPPPQLNIQC